MATDQPLDQTAPDPSADETPKDDVQTAPESDDDGINKKIEDILKKRVEACKRQKRDLVADWKTNVDMRLGKVTNVPALTGTSTLDDDTQSTINPDWSLTKIKTSNLFSQVPEVQGSHENKQYEAAVPLLLKALNYEMSAKRMNIGASIKEALNDCVNASGVGAVFIGYEATTEMQDIPAIDGIMKMLPPQIVQAGLKAGLIPTKQVERVVDSRLFSHRISPMDLLWASEFNGSDFNDSDYLGFTGRMPWARGKNEFKLKDEDKDKVLAGDPSLGGTEDSLRSTADKSNLMDAKYLTYDVVYYWRNRFDPDEKFFKAIWKLVYVRGIEKPVIHEPYTGQRLEGNSYVGVTRLPVTVLTLTYISDNPIPPSDSEAGRAQVNDLRRSRAQMFANRERSIPLRWFNTSLVDPLIHENMMRGVVQGMIPMNGDGSRAIGEVARASYPVEDLTFDTNSKQELIESWVSQPTASTTSRPNKEQVQASQATMASRIGEERNQTTSFLLNLCDVILGLLVLYSDFPVLTDQEKQTLKQTWDATKITHDLVLKVRPDSTIVLDSAQRLDKLFKFLNFTVKSGFVMPKQIIVEAAELSGIDPADVVVDPKPPKPPDPNVSFRFSGKQDLMNPVVMAILMQAGISPSPEMLEAAKKLLSAMQEPAAPPASPQPGAPAGPGHPPVPPPTGGRPGVALPPGTPEAHPHWSLGGRIAKRNRDASGG